MKKKVWFSLIIAVLVVVLSLGMVACNKKKKQQQEAKDTLVVGYDLFSNKFSPFFSETAYDQDVWSLTQIGLIAADRQGAIVYKGIDGETIKYNGTDYTYYGLSNVTVTKNADNSVYYDVTIRSGDNTVYFSDGQPVTIDDVIFSMYVLSDPDYDGSSTFYSLPIKGMQSYRLDLDQEIIDDLQPKAEDIVLAWKSTYDAYDAAIKALEDTFNTTYATAISTYKAAIAAADEDYDEAVEAAEALTDETAKATALEQAEVDCDEAYEAAVTARNNTEVGTKKYSVAADELKTAKAAVTVQPYVANSRANPDKFTMTQYESFVNSIWTVGGAALANDIISYVVANYGKYLPMFGNNQVATGMAVWGFGGFGTAAKVADAATEEKENGAMTDKGKDLYIIKDDAEDDDVEFECKVSGTKHKFVAATGKSTGTLYTVAATHVKNGAVIEVAAYTGDVYVSVDEDNFYTSPLGQKYTLEGTSVPTVDVYAANLKAAYGNNFIKAADVEKANSNLDGYMQEVINKWMQTEGASQQAGRKIASIAGITKTSPNSLRVTTTSFDAVTIYQLAIAVAPKHYYGNGQYNYDQNNFGFTKGDLTVVRSKTTAPMGAGAYKFVSFQDGIVTFERNENYWEGTPKIKYIKFKEYASDSDKTPALINGDIDISSPSISNTVIDIIKGANSNGALDGNVIKTDLVDYNGYGYIGICADVVRVGAKDSAASKNLRKAYATLFAAYREYTVNSYYGDRASVIQYPISNCSWAAPQATDTGYEIAFSKNAEGQAIYTADMNEEQKFAAAKTAAIGYFKAAGFTQDAQGNFTDVPEYEFWIPGGGSGDHPTLALANKVSEVLATIGVSVKVKDLANSNDLWDALAAHSLAFWAAAWGGSSDPDMYQVYHGDNKTGSNHYGINDTQLNQIIMDARATDVVSTRKNYYKQALNIILDWAVEVPVYQRKDCVIYSTDRVNLNTLTPDRTPYWSYLSEIYTLEVNA